jgi:hypothetical protein
MSRSPSILSLAGLSLFSVLAVGPPAARADWAGAQPNDAGTVTHIEKGVKELDVGALGILSSDSQSDVTATRVSGDVSATFAYYVRNGVSVGGTVLFDYDSPSDVSSSTAFGGTVDATVHARLGFGAFFRPGLSLGMLFGNQNQASTPGLVMQASEVGFIARLRLPLAYFVNQRFLLQAGPQLDLITGTYTPTTGDAQSFTRIAGGFAIGAGYVF